jgi:parallel beta-helix repeat protein
MARLDSYAADSFVAKQIRRLSLSNTYINVADYGAVADGATDNLTAFQNAVNAAGDGRVVVIPPGTYALSDSIIGVSNLVMIGIGKPVLKTTASSPVTGVLLFRANTKSNIYINGVVWDGNMSSVTLIEGRLTQFFACTDCIMENCTWQNARTIGHYQTGTVRCGVINSFVSNVGAYNRTSGLESDRKQGLAFDTDQAPICNGNRLTLIGLDPISVTDSSYVSINDNLVYDSDASGIYMARNTGGTMIGNNIYNGGSPSEIQGLGIDMIESTDFVVSNNHVKNCGSGGILVGSGCKRITVTGNVCVNNCQYSANENFFGGICISFGTGQSTEDIVISGNVCDDDQGAGTTQLYAIGTGITGGTFKNIVIAKDNVLVGRTAAGAVEPKNTFQDATFGAQPYPMTFDLANNATMNVCHRGSRGRLLAVLTDSDVIGDFYLKPNSAPIEINSSTWETTDTGSVAALYDDGATSIKLKNRTGSSKTFTVALDWNSVAQ